MGVNCGGPGGEELIESWSTADIEMLPSSVGRDGMIVGSKVSLVTH